MNEHINIRLAEGLALALQRQRLVPGTNLTIKFKGLIPKETKNYDTYKG